MRDDDFMSQEARQLLNRFDALPEQDQQMVAVEILRRRVDGPESTVAGSESAPFSEDEWAEIERRRAEHARNPSSAIPWEEVRARLFRRFA